MFSDHRKLKALVASDFAFFAATWWPKAKSEELTVLLFFSIWLFNWDDEIDEPCGIYTDDLEGAERYRSQTIDFAAQCLGLQDLAPSTQTRAQNKIIASFKDVGEPLVKAYTVGTSNALTAMFFSYARADLDSEQRQRFMAELLRFINHTGQEQNFRLRKDIPTISEYWSFRMGTSAVGVVVAIQE